MESKAQASKTAAAQTKLQINGEFYSSEFKIVQNLSGMLLMTHLSVFPLTKDTGLMMGDNRRGFNVVSAADQPQSN